MTGTGDEALLGAILPVLPAGLAAFDGEGRLILASDALWAQLGPGVKALPPGASQAEVVRLLAHAGHYGHGDPEALAQAALRLDRSRPRSRLVRNRAGRWHSLSSVPLPGGGHVTLSIDTTDARRAEAEAQARARLLDDVLGQVTTGVVRFDAEGRIAYCNPAYGELLHLGPDLLRPGVSYGEVVSAMVARGEFANQDEEAVARIRREVAALPPVFTRERPDGLVYRARGQEMRGGGWLYEVDDVTALRRAEDEARERAALLDGVLDALPHGVCVYGPDRRVTRVNAAYQRLLAGAEVSIGDHIEEVLRQRLAAGEYPGEDPAEVFRQVVQAAPSPTVDRVRTRPDGTVLSVRTAALPGGGRIFVVTDVTARARAEAEAQHRAEVLNAMLENLRDGIVLFDADGYLLAANSVAARLIGVPAEEVMAGRHMLELRAAQLRANELGATAAERETFLRERGPRPWAAEGLYYRSRPDGSVVKVRTTAMPGGGFLRTYRDVTEDLRVKAELERARDAAEEGSRAKSRFLTAMTHELRTPLHAVIGFSEAMLGERKPERLHDYAGQVLASGRQLLELIDAILEVARVEAGQLALDAVTFDPAPLMRDAAAGFERACREAGLDFRMDIPPALPHVTLDKAKLRQVLSHLLSNALKFTPRGGGVTFVAGADEGRVSVRVEDTGIGMEEGEIARAFEPFVQLEGGHARSYAGTGLGLFLARALTSAMGGRLGLQSVPGQGTIATLSFDAAEMRGSAPGKA